MSANASNTEIALPENNLIGKLLAGAFLSDFKEGGKSGPQILQSAVAKIKKWLGHEDAKKFFDASESSSKCLFYACVEYTITGKLTEETIDLMKGLDQQQRVWAEIVYLKATGQDVVKKNTDTHWAKPLWNIKQMMERYIGASPTEISHDDVCVVVKNVAWSFVLTLREHARKLF